MPGINKDIKDQQADIEAVENGENQEDQQPQQERELTQTDHINRHLLVALREAMEELVARIPNYNKNQENSDDTEEWADEEPK